MVHGRSQYIGEDGKTLKTEFDNIFVLQFNEEGVAQSTVSGMWSDLEETSKWLVSSNKYKL
ncbi:MAG: hypothetical protein NVSMB49_10820 [Ktedonobacteraceae bacterium]